MRLRTTIALVVLLVLGTGGVAGCGDVPEEYALSCGDATCDLRDQYCERRTSSASGDRYACKSLPSECGDEPSCSCLDGEECGSSCSSNNDEITLTCSE